MVKLKVGNDLNNMKSMDKHLFKYIINKNIPGIILRDLWSIYAIVYIKHHTYILGLLKCSKNLLFCPKTLTKSSTNNSFYQREKMCKRAQQVLISYAGSECIHFVRIIVCLATTD